MEGATRVRLRVRNGYQKTAQAVRRQRAGQGVTVVLLPSGKTVDVDADRRVRTGRR